MNKDRPNFAVTSEEAEKSKKRGTSSEEQIPDDRHHEDESKKIPVASEAPEQSRESTTYGHTMDKILDLPDQGNSTSHTDGGKDSQTDKNATLGQITSDESRFESIHSKIRDPINKLSSLSYHFHNQDNKKTSIFGANTSSNMNISQAVNSNNKVAAIAKLIRSSMHSPYNITAIPGPSSGSENASSLHLSAKTIKTPSKVQKAVDMEKPSMLLASSKKRISDHFEVDESKNYKPKKRTKKSPPKLFCNICNDEYTDVNKHGIAQACNECGQIFSCRMLLHKHYFTHEDYHHIYCLVCQKFIGDHLIEPHIYKCCTFNCYETESLTRFKMHLYIHSYFKYFPCNLCGERLNSQYYLKIHLKKCKNKNNI